MIPESLARSCNKTPERRAWMEKLPSAIERLAVRWSLALEDPFDGDEVSCSWVAFATRNDGTQAVLKIGMPHMEGRDEIAGLRVGDGDGVVRLLESDDTSNAMLLERCVPGTRLRACPEEEQDVVIAGLLRRLWRTPPASAGFRPLSEMMAHWTSESLRHAADWADPPLVREGLGIFAELIRSTTAENLLATDLHAGNVLRAEREPWLVIDPKPFAGDPAYDATQHLLNCRQRLREHPRETIERFANLLGVDAERVRLWTFARVASEPRDDWRDAELLDLARVLTSL